MEGTLREVTSQLSREVALIVSFDSEPYCHRG